MADAGGEAESAADRLEAALERIAELAARPGAAASPVLPEVADRLDALIAQLRQALDGPPA
jgi:MoxR-like ATPase